MFYESDSEVWKKVSALIESEGFSLYDLERFGSDGLRVTISRKGFLTQDSKKPKAAAEKSDAGVSCDDCAKICRSLQVMLSVEGAELGLGLEPRLEVASPGVNRSLRIDRHFAAAVGERVKIVSDVDLVGILEAYEDNSLKVKVEKSGDLVMVSQLDVKRARIEFLF